MKTVTVNKVKIDYKGETVFEGYEYDMFDLDLLAEELAEEFFEDDTREETPYDEWCKKVTEIRAELEDNIEYYEEEEVDEQYYLEQEYYRSVL